MPADFVRQTREVRASVQRARAERDGCHDTSKPENAKQCIETWTMECLDMSVSKNRGFSRKMDGLQWKTLLKWMIWGENPLFSETSI